MPAASDGMPATSVRPALDPSTGPATGLPTGDTTAARAPVPRQAPAWLVEAVRSLEAARALDAPAAVLQRAARAVARPGTPEEVLTGAWLGHALHPLLTDLPIGFWTSASVLDLIGGRQGRRAADRLLALGVVTAAPTVATGLAEWLHADRAARRVGVVHASANAAGLALYTASLAARLRSRRARGVLLALAGAAAATVGGYLGGHLTTARKVGTRDDAFAGPPPDPDVVRDATGGPSVPAGPRS